MSETTKSVNVAKERTGAPPGGLAVPWFTVVTLAVVMAYAAGFWLISLRGDIGAIERTQGPFADWLRESTLALPLFVFAVLGALTLALRWFGPVLRKPRTVVATALLVVAAGTLMGIAEMAASSAYDYQLQSKQLQFMHSVHHTSAPASVLAAQQQATIGLHVRGVALASVLLLVTNLVLVGWVVAFRGGRLDVSTTRHASALPAAATSAADTEHSSRIDGLRLLLAAGMDPAGMLAFFERLSKEAGADEGVLLYLSTHPSSRERRIRLQELAASLPRPRPAVPLTAPDWRAIRGLCAPAGDH